MKFYCFPKKQIRCLIYSDFTGFNSKLFSDLALQLSAKNSFYYSLNLTSFGHLTSIPFKYRLSVPNPNAEYIGFKKKNRHILFEMENNEPVRVWKKKKTDVAWKNEPFLGYQLVSEYSIKEFRKKKPLLQKALKMHKKRFIDQNIIHGDLTHFNILHNANKEIFFIDKLNMINSPLFDYFYFYSYLKQCLERNKALGEPEMNLILKLVGDVIINTANYKNSESFTRDFELVNIPVITGIKDNNRKRFLREFKELFKLL